MIASLTRAESIHRRVTWSVLILLLILRIPFTIAIIYFLPIENQYGAAVYEISTYILTAFLIWWERKSLSNFHIDSSALTMIVLLRPLQTLILAYWKIDTPLVFPGPLSLIICGTALILTISLWRNGYKPARLSFSTLSWLAIGILIGVSISIAENFGTFRSISSNNGSFPTTVFLSTSVNVFYHLGFAPINEEPLFRGFLWGALRQLKWKDGWILILQAILFTSAHVYFANQYPFMFWVYIPASAIVLGILTMRSRSISSAILAHGMINGSVYVLVAGILSSIHR